MSSNKFLQRFEGKIQVVGKEGVQNVFVGKNQPVPVYTNNNFNHQNKNKTSSSLNKNKVTQEKPKQVIDTQKKIPKPLANEQINKKQQHKGRLPPQNKQKKIQVNPFLISNPFYLDEEDRQKIEKERKERQLQEKLQLQREKQRQRQLVRLQNQDNKKNTTGSLNKSLEKKKLNQKQWTKLGGLGANIGGQQWTKKKQKLDKMQQFSQQVKQINKDKPKIPKSDKRQQKSQLNPRQKAIQYSKNVPRPVVRVVQSQRQQGGHEQQQQIIQQQLTQLQLYELKHEQYKNMLKNQ